MSEVLIISAMSEVLIADHHHFARSADFCGLPLGNANKMAVH